MTVSIEMDTHVALGSIQRQHDGTITRMYRAWTREAPKNDISDLARDPELVYNLDAVEACGVYIDQHDNP